jgi:hypothetical protein
MLTSALRGVVLFSRTRSHLTQNSKAMQVLRASSENLPENPAKFAKVEQMDILRVKKLSENATLPKRGSAGAAGYDLAR